MPMNPDLKARWVEALRSGKFIQAPGRLHRTRQNGDRGAGYCCLGVLAEIDGRLSLDPDEHGVCHLLDEKGKLTPDVSRLSHSYADKIGLSEMDESRLIEMNDGVCVLWDRAEIKPISFREIADYIEANL